MIFKAHGAVHVCVREMVKKNVVLLIIDATCDMKRRSHLLHVLQHDDTDTDTRADARTRMRDLRDAVMVMAVRARARRFVRRDRAYNRFNAQHSMTA